MNQSMRCNPKLLIDGKLIQSLKNANFTDGGSNTLQTLTATFTDPDLENIQLFNKLVEFYLNAGSEDGVPLFRGYIKQVNATNSAISISAQDPRIFLSGKDSFPVSLTEKNNYDGFTLSQFLYDFITDEINNNSTLIGTDDINEIDKPSFLTNIRGVENIPYDIVSSNVEQKVDTDDPLKVFGYSLGILHGEESSSIIFIKQKDKDEVDPVCTFTYSDGIVKLKYKERAPPSFGVASGTVGDEEFVTTFEYGNAPKGKVGLRLQESFEDKSTAMDNILARIITEQENTKEISLEVSKGYYYNTESLINIDVPDTNIYGTYRITSKSINYSETSLTCILNLNKKRVKISEYIN